jgi:hypothetical protein
VESTSFGEKFGEKFVVILRVYFFLQQAANSPSAATLDGAGVSAKGNPK